jgi:Xaa-Pro aminopeptidase
MTDAKKRAKRAAKKKTAKAAQPAAGGPQDTDMQTLAAAAAAVTEIDRRYRLANINDQIQLKQKRDEAFAAYSLARLKLLDAGMITTAADVTEMRRLKAEIDRAAVRQALIIAAARVVVFLAKMAAK